MYPALLGGRVERKFSGHHIHFGCFTLSFGHHQDCGQVVCLDPNRGTIPQAFQPKACRYTKMARLALGLEFVQQFGTYVGHEKFDRPMLDPEDASHSEWASVCDYLGLDVHLS